MTHAEGEPNEYQTFYDELDENYADPWRVKVDDFLNFLARNKLKTAAAGTAFLATLGSFAFLGRYTHQNSPEESFGSGSGPGAAGPGTSVSVNPNQTPTRSSGGFSVGNVSLKCTGIDIERIADTSEYLITPEVTVSEGDRHSPYLYTIVGLYNEANAVSAGISPVRVNGPDVAPVVAVVDVWGTRLDEKPNNPDALVKPLGDFPDGLINLCPLTTEFLTIMQ